MQEMVQISSNDVGSLGWRPGVGGCSCSLPPSHNAMSVDKAMPSPYLRLWAAESWHRLRWYVVHGHYTIILTRKVTTRWFLLQQTQNLWGGIVKHLAEAQVMHEWTFPLLDVKNRQSDTQTLYPGCAVTNSKHLPAFKAVNFFAAKWGKLALLLTCSLPP